MAFSLAGVLGAGLTAGANAAAPFVMADVQQKRQMQLERVRNKFRSDEADKARKHASKEALLGRAHETQLASDRLDVTREGQEIQREGLLQRASEHSDRMELGRETNELTKLKLEADIAAVTATKEFRDAQAAAQANQIDPALALAIEMKAKDDLSGNYEGLTVYDLAKMIKSQNAEFRGMATGASSDDETFLGLLPTP